MNLLQVALLMILSLFAPLAHAYSGYGDSKLITIDQYVAIQGESYSAQSLLMFERNGKFHRELSCKMDVESYLYQFLGGNGKEVWLAGAIYSEDRSQTLVLVRCDAAGSNNQSHKLAGAAQAKWNDGKIYVINAGESSKNTQADFIIQLFDQKSQQLRPYVALPKGDRRILDWTPAKDSILLLVYSQGSTELESYNPAGKLLWTTRVQSDLIEDPNMQIAEVSLDGTIYLISNPGTELAELLPVDQNGKAKASKVFEDLMDVAKLDRTVLGLFPRKIQDLSNPSIEWTYNAPVNGETWDEKWQREKKALLVSARSSTEDLLMAFAYSIDQEQLQNVMNWLNERGDAAIPVVMDKFLELPNSYIYYYLNQLQQEKPEVVASLMEKAFPDASYDAKKVILQHFVRYPQQLSSPDMIKAFLKELEKGTEEDQEIAKNAGILWNTDLTAMDQWIERLQKPETTDKERGEILYQLMMIPDVGLEKLGPVLKNSATPKRDELLMHLLSFFMYLTEMENDPTKAEKTRELLGNWQTGSDPLLSDFASVALLLLGDNNYFGPAVEAAKRNPSLQRVFFGAFVQYAQDHRAEADEFSRDLLKLAMEYKDTSEKADSDYDVRASLISTLAGAELPGMRKAILEQALNLTLDPKLRAGMFYGLASCVDQLEQPDILQLLRNVDPSSQSERSMYVFLVEVGKKFANEREIREMVRAQILYDLSRADSSNYSEILNVLDHFVEPEDIPVVLPFLEMQNVSCGGGLVDQALNLIAKAGYTSDLEDRILPFLDGPEHAIYAARVLALDKHPRALEVLLRALESDNNYDLDARHFRPYGAAAENRLIPLLYSNREQVRTRAILILGELKNQEAYPVLRRMMEEDIAGNTLNPAVIAALLYFGEDAWSLALQGTPLSEAACGKLMRSFYYFPEPLAESSVNRLSKLLKETTDAAKARTILCFLTSAATFEEYSTPVLEEIRKNHPSPEIRKLIEEPSSKPTRRRLH